MKRILTSLAVIAGAGLSLAGCGNDVKATQSIPGSSGIVGSNGMVSGSRLIQDLTTHGTVVVLSQNGTVLPQGVSIPRNPSFVFTSKKGLTGDWWVGDSAPDLVNVNVDPSIQAAQSDANSQNYAIYQAPDATPVDSGGDVVRTKNIVVMGDPNSPSRAVIAAAVERASH